VFFSICYETSETVNYEDNSTRFKKSNAYKILMEESYRKDHLQHRKKGGGGRGMAGGHEVEMANDHVQC
jgi:hypothetical protein